MYAIASLTNALITYIRIYRTGRFRGYMRVGYVCQDMVYALPEFNATMKVVKECMDPGW